MTHAAATIASPRAGQAMGSTQTSMPGTRGPAQDQLSELKMLHAHSLQNIRNCSPRQSEFLQGAGGKGESTAFAAWVGHREWDGSGSGRPAGRARDEGG